MPKKPHEPPIPEGLQVYEDRLQVVGVHRRKAAATAFARSNDIWLELERLPDRQRDEHAIKVIGCSKGWFFRQRRFIGYLDRDVARAIVRGGLWGKVIPRLLETSVSDKGFIEVLFQILGPKEEKKNYDRLAVFDAGAHHDNDND
jgi:hypothetical protein